MTAKKKYLLFLIIAVMAVVIIGIGTVTYAWFLSLFSSEYEFQLDSDDHNRVVLIYESDLAFLSGDINTSTNVIIPAVAKQTTGMAQSALGPLDVFDVDTVTPSHTGKVQTVAQAAHFTATGAYWVGASDTIGVLTFSLAAYAKDAGVPNTTYDLIDRGELSYFVLFTYMSDKYLYYNGQYYMNDTQNYTMILPDLFGVSTLCYWRPLTASDVKTDPYRSVASFVFTTDGTQFLLAPNSEFTYDLYVFAAKTDAELDPYLKGKAVQLRATIMVPPVVAE